MTDTLQVQKAPKEVSKSGQVASVHLAWRVEKGEWCLERWLSQLHTQPLLKMLRAEEVRWRRWLQAWPSSKTLEAAPWERHPGLRAWPFLMRGLVELKRRERWETQLSHSLRELLLKSRSAKN